MRDLIIWSPGVTLDDIEKQVILKAFQFYRGNKAATASALGITTKTLDNKFERYEKDAADWREREANEQRERDAFLKLQREGRPATAVAPATGGEAAASKPSSVGIQASAGVRVEPASRSAKK